VTATVALVTATATVLRVTATGCAIATRTARAPSRSWISRNCREIALGAISQLNRPGD
jgi:hypothetical protein